MHYFEHGLLRIGVLEEGRLISLPSIYLSYIPLSLQLSTQYISLSVCLYVCLSVCLSVYQSTYLSYAMVGGLLTHSLCKPWYACALLGSSPVGIPNSIALDSQCKPHGVLKSIWNPVWSSWLHSTPFKFNRVHSNPSNVIQRHSSSLKFSQPDIHSISVWCMQTAELWWTLMHLNALLLRMCIIELECLNDIKSSGGL